MNENTVHNINIPPLGAVDMLLSNQDDMLNYIKTWKYIATQGMGYLDRKLYQKNLNTPPTKEQLEQLKEIKTNNDTNNNILERQEIKVLDMLKQGNKAAYDDYRLSQDNLSAVLLNINLDQSLKLNNLLNKTFNIAERSVNAIEPQRIKFAMMRNAGFFTELPVEDKIKSFLYFIAEDRVSNDQRKTLCDQITLLLELKPSLDYKILHKGEDALRKASLTITNSESFKKKYQLTEPNDAQLSAFFNALKETESNQQVLKNFVPKIIEKISIEQKWRLQRYYLFLLHENMECAEDKINKLIDFKVVDGQIQQKDLSNCNEFQLLKDLLQPMPNCIFKSIFIKAEVDAIKAEAILSTPMLGASNSDVMKQLDEEYKKAVGEVNKAKEGIIRLQPDNISFGTELATLIETRDKAIKERDSIRKKIIEQGDSFGKIPLKHKFLDDDVKKQSKQAMASFALGAVKLLHLYLTSDGKNPEEIRKKQEQILKNLGIDVMCAAITIGVGVFAGPIGGKLVGDILKIFMPYDQDPSSLDKKIENLQTCVDKGFLNIEKKLDTIEKTIKAFQENIEKQITTLDKKSDFRFALLPKRIEYEATRAKLIIDLKKFAGNVDSPNASYELLHIGDNITSAIESLIGLFFHEKFKVNENSLKELKQPQDNSIASYVIDGNKKEYISFHQCCALLKTYTEDLFNLAQGYSEVRHKWLATLAIELVFSHTGDKGYRGDIFAQLRANYPSNDDTSNELQLDMMMLDYTLIGANNLVLDKKIELALETPEKFDFLCGFGLEYINLDENLESFYKFARKLSDSPKNKLKELINSVLVSHLENEVSKHQLVESINSVLSLSPKDEDIKKAKTILQKAIQAEYSARGNQFQQFINAIEQAFSDDNKVMTINKSPTLWRILAGGQLN